MFILLFSETSCTSYSQTQPPPTPPHTFPLPLPYMRYDVPLMCHTEMRTAGWEAGCTLGAHRHAKIKLRRERRHSCAYMNIIPAGETQEQRPLKLMAFSLSSSVSLGLLWVQNTGRSTYCYLCAWYRKINSGINPCCWRSFTVDINNCLNMSPAANITLYIFCPADTIHTHVSANTYTVGVVYRE